MEYQMNIKYFSLHKIIFQLLFSILNLNHWLCNGWHARLECGRLWVWALVRSNKRL